MKCTTSQCRSVSSGTPFASAIASAICEFHSCGSVRKPSASTSTGESAISVAVILSPFSGVSRCASLSAGRHLAPDARDLPAGEQGVPVDPLEGELAEVVQPGLAQERQPEGGG